MTTKRTRSVRCVSSTPTGIDGNRKTPCPLCQAWETQVECEMAIEDAKQKVRYLSKWARKPTQERILAATIELLEAFYKLG